MCDLAGAVRRATMTLAEAGIASAPVDAALLAAHLLGVDTGEVRRLMVLGGTPKPSGYDELVTERAHRVPLQHLTGVAHFRRLTLSVGPGVFVPRPETELLVEHALNALKSPTAPRGRERPLVVDLCTGSGAIALSVKDEYPAARVVAVELSPAAHAWATQNVARTALTIELHLGDATTALPELDGTADVVVSNPPYIPVGAVPVDPEVRDHDPEVALYGGSADGLALPLTVAERAASLLRGGGTLVMEHGDTQGETLVGALAETGWWSIVADHPDLVGKPRHVVARRA